MVAIIMLAVLQRSGLQTGLATMAAAVAIALAIPSFRLAPDTLLVAVAEGAATSLTVLYVLFPALLLYQLLRITGGIGVLASGIGRLCPDRDVQVLLLVLGLAPFVESVSGFGVGTVVVIPMLAALGIDALLAAILGLLGQIAVPWGALAVGTTLGAELTRLNPNILGAHTALLTAPLPVGFGLVALAISGGRKSVRRLWPAALAAGIVLAGGEWLFSQFPGVELAGALASVPTIVLLAAWGHLVARRSSRAQETMEPGTTVSDRPEGTRGEETTNGQGEVNPPRLRQAVAPYAILTALLLISRLIVPLQQWLQAQGVLTVPAIGLQFPLLYSPGFYVFLAAFTTVPLLGTGMRGFRTASIRTLRQFTPGAVAIVSFLAASQVMRASGMITVLGTAAAALGGNYSWIAPWLGAIGGWLTGSNAGGNAMFAQLQREASARAGLPLDWLMAAQNGAGSIATMVSPARTVLAATTAGIVGREGQIVRKVGPPVLAAVVVIMLLLVWVV
jgi:lactate permease